MGFSEAQVLPPAPVVEPIGREIVMNGMERECV